MGTSGSESAVPELNNIDSGSETMGLPFRKCQRVLLLSVPDRVKRSLIRLGQIPVLVPLRLCAPVWLFGFAPMLHLTVWAGYAEPVPSAAVLATGGIVDRRHIQPAIKIIAEQTTELGNDAGQTAFVNVNHCRMPIGVGIYTALVDDGDILEDVLIHVDSFR